MKFKVWHYITLAAMAVVVVALSIGNWLCSVNSQAITNLICGMGYKFDGEDVALAAAESDALIRQICEDGIIMLKNEGGEDGKGVLPLKEDNRKLNLFGWTSTDNGFFLTGGGSGAAQIVESKKYSLRKGLESQGFEINTDLLAAYTRYYGGGGWYSLIEPGRDFYTESLMSQAKSFSDTALITISRTGAENTEIPYIQEKYKGTTDRSRTYLQISTEEEALIELVTENFENVIVIINSANMMELGFLDNPKIDAALNVGFCGQSGTTAIGRILKGEINPSGRTVDTYAYDLRSAPSYANNRRDGDHIHYVEGIYIGYKWYETAFADKLKHTAYGKTFDYSSEEKYRETVQFPFGYGLSYTSFEWNVDSAKVIAGDETVGLNGASIANKKAKIEVTVSVTNTGDTAGKETVQLYYSAPYKEGEIEKPALSLADFAKTSLLQPGMTEPLTLEFDLYDMASYDCYDKNGNGAATYELDDGEYCVKLMNNAHELNPCDNAEIKFNLPNKLNYKLDPETKQIVKNRFTGDTAYADVPIDGSTAGEPITYLTRGAFAETFPVEATPNRAGANVKKANSYVYTGYDGAEAPEYGKSGDLKIWTRKDGSAATRDDLKGTSGVELTLNEDLVLKLGANYKAAEYDALLSQITLDELFTLVESSGYGNDEMVSIGKAFNRDSDGPSGFQLPLGSTGEAGWCGYTSETMVAATFSKMLAFQMGRAMGNEGSTVGVSGWYAPGVNLHRSPFNGRYFEYYSEDGVLSGKLAAQVIRGATSANVYCFLKHFALSEMGINPRDLNVWITEQALRETYLKPFELAVKGGEANAIMTAFNRIGGTWAGGSKALCTDILRTEWGFKGVVITDWSVGDSYMQPYQGVRAGNDIWLNPNNSSGEPLNRKDPVNIYLARKAAHNMIYTISNTYYRYKNYDPKEGEFVVQVGIRKMDKVFPWWIPLLVALDVIVFGIIIFETVWIMLKARKAFVKAKAASGPPPEAAAPQPDASANE